MVDRICISLNNRCNLSCEYCHFSEKGDIVPCDMDVFEILRNVKDYAKHEFKIGFVGNGEPFLDFRLLKECVQFLSDSKHIKAYTITNGTVRISDEDIRFLEDNGVNVGFSLDGPRDLHNKYRCNSYDKVISSVEQYKNVTGHYPTFNATIGRESLSCIDEILSFFEKYGTRVTFSRMIGKNAISLEEYRNFLAVAEKRLEIRRGGLDCTMYGGKCGAGENNFFFANGNVYFCGNCVDLPPIGKSDISFYELEKVSLNFNRDFCYKESYT